MLNKVILIGRLTKDVELRYIPSGTAVGKFTIAVDRRQVKDREKETDFVDIVVWSKLAENCANYIGKGRLVAVSGRLQIRSYEDSQGIRRKAAEVVAEDVKFLDRGKDSTGGGSQTSGSGNGYGSGSGSQNSGNASGEGDYSYGSEISFDDDEIPF